MSSSSAPSGVLNELSARPTKRRRTEASAARSAPKSGAHPARNVTSIPFSSSALSYGDRPPNSHLHHSQLWRADAPEPQGTTAQQPALDNAAVHENCPAADNRPPLRGRLGGFAQLSQQIRHGTGRSRSNTLYPLDKELIAQFVEGAERGGSSFVTTKTHANMLIRFSDWLRQQNRGGLQDGLLKKELKDDATNFQKGMKRDYLATALKYLHAFDSSPDRTVNIPIIPQHEASDADKKFINAALSTKPYHATALRAFSAWLHAENKKGLCETDRLHSQALMDDAKTFAKTRLAGSQKSVTALRQLRNFYLTGKMDFTKKSNTREIHEVDRQLYEQYKDILSMTLSASGSEKKYNNRQTYSARMSGFMKYFSGWLKANQKASMATRLHDTTLDDDLNIFKGSNSKIYASNIRGMLAQVRDIFPSDVQSPEQVNKPQIHDVDRQLSEKFKNALLAPGRETTSINQEKYAGLLSAHVRHFSAWLQENEKEPLASRLHEPTLDSDLEFYIRDKDLGYQSVLKHMLMQVRQMYPSNVQLPDLGSRGEPAEPSYSSMFPLTHEGGWPQAAEGVWIPDTPEQEVTIPALPAQPEASSLPFEFDWGGALHQSDFLLQGHQSLSQTHQSNWDLDNFSDQLMAHSWPTQPGESSSSFAFDPNAPQPEATEPQHTNVMPQASIPTLEQNDIGLDWNDGEQRVPE
ncbi:hypothetical protein [Xanthomonas fragariae]|uniref:hypothetical protein n=1 Tax=Xanthomonas fragariae TaxID=48664 RepID=UPI001ABE378F|nr:hypothetical protein [Xanthomonas fragariae]